VITRSFVLIFLATLTLLGGCSSGPQAQPQAPQEQYPEAVFTPGRLFPADHVVPDDVYDPWQGMNTRIYNFNYHFDQKVFLPVVLGYQTVLPQFARTGVHNFFNNFRDVVTMFNSALQVSPTKFFQSTIRVLTNTTIGVLGLVDVATMMEVPRPEEDFGQTLGYWGVPQGPYLVIPFLGPSNLRDGVGLVPDLYVQSFIQGEALERTLRQFVFLFNGVDTRNETAFRYYENGSAYEYEMVRYMWSTKRDLDILK
jgi:phospholipid-binding lipoprotein MlaA